MSERSSSVLSTVVGMALPTLGSSDCREGRGGEGRGGEGRGGGGGGLIMLQNTEEPPMTFHKGPAQRSHLVLIQ